LARRLGLARVPGFAEWIGGSASREEVLQRTPVPGLKIVHAGSAAVAAKGIRSGRRPEELLRALAEGYQVVLLDVPSILDHPEFRPLVSCADVVVPVFGAWASTKEGARRLLLAIEAAGKDVPGAILNRWRSVRPFWWPRTMEF
jgi:tyrosine-protein kinase Etk/Wzc